MIKTDTTLVSKNQLLDYLSKRDFNDFVVDMRDFQEITNARFNSIDKQLIAMNRNIDQFKEDVRVQVGVVLDQFRENTQITMEYVQNIEKTKVDEIRFNALKEIVDSWGPRKHENHF